MTWLIVALFAANLACITLAVVALFVAFSGRDRAEKSLKRAEKLADMAEGYGAIADRQKERMENVVGEASARAEQVAKQAAKTTTEKAEDIKQFVVDRINDVRTEITEVRVEFVSRFEHLERLIEEKIK